MFIYSFLSNVSFDVFINIGSLLTYVKRVVELETVGFVWSLQVKPQVHKPSAYPSTSTSTTTSVAKV